MTKPKRLVIIDGHHLLHRAFHALPGFTDKAGRPTNAIYGFFSMFFKLLQDYEPDYFTVAFDVPQPTFRVEEVWQDYQIKRPPMPDQLKNQVTSTHQVLKAAQISFFEKAGFEADDIIATLVRQSLKSQILKSQSPSIEILIVSGDRDLLQLVNDHVQILAPVTGLTKIKVYDPQAVLEQYGVTPKQIPDYKALIGDPSDNYPGVAGIGPKTAVSLLKQYQTLEGIYKTLKETARKPKSTPGVDKAVIISPKIALALAEGFESADTGKRLALLIDNVPLDFNLNDTDLKKINWQSLKQEFQTLGFKSLIKRLEEIVKIKIESSSQISLI